MIYVTFETELFFTDIPSEQVDSWFPGGDCCGWFYSRLIPLDKISQDLDPTMEDWGWIMAVKAQEITVEIYVWEHIDREMSWVLGIAAKKKWLRKTPTEVLEVSEKLVAKAIEAILNSDDRFTVIEWSAENPMENP